jgi:hypothetical protein
VAACFVQANPKVRGLLLWASRRACPSSEREHPNLSTLGLTPIVIYEVGGFRMSDIKLFRIAEVAAT